MKILVTGAAGAIGSHVAERFAKEGHDVIGIDCLTDYYDPNIKVLNKKAIEDVGCKVYPHDLAVDDIRDIVSGTEIVFHFAAQPGLSSKVPFDVFVRNNIIATHRLMEAMKEVETLKLFVNISTSSVYGIVADGDETTVPQPTSPYGVTKLAAEQLAMSYFREHAMPVVSLRLFSVYGERERPEKLFHKLTKSILENTPFPMYQGADHHRRSYTYISDIVEACVLTVEHQDKVIGEIINIGTDTVISTKEGISIIEKAIGKEALINKVPARPGDQRETSANIGKARKLLGYNPTVLPEEGLPREVNWYKENLFSV